MTFLRTRRRGLSGRGKRTGVAVRVPTVGAGTPADEMPGHAAFGSGIPLACSCGWRILDDGIVDPHDGRRFTLVKHGLDFVTAMQQVAHCRVVLGRFPVSREITGDTETITAALKELSTSGAHFTYFASGYRDGNKVLLLLDYIG